MSCFYDEESLSIINDMFAADFDAFGSKILRHRLRFGPERRDEPARCGA
jgi:hypothetical protein